MIMVKEKDKKIKKYLEYMTKLRKLENELNFAYIIPGGDNEGKSIQQLQMTFLWNLGFALVDPQAFLVDRPVIKYAAPEDMPKEKFDKVLCQVIKIERDFMKKEFTSLDPYMNELS